MKIYIAWNNSDQLIICFNNKELLLQCFTFNKITVLRIMLWGRVLSALLSCPKCDVRSSL